MSVYNDVGNGAQGDVTISDANTIINLYGSVKSATTSGKVLTITNPTGTFSKGMEILFHVTNTDAGHASSYGLYFLRD